MVSCTIVTKTLNPMTTAMYTTWPVQKTAGSLDTPYLFWDFPLRHWKLDLNHWNRSWSLPVWFQSTRDLNSSIRLWKVEFDLKSGHAMNFSARFHLQQYNLGAVDLQSEIATREQWWPYLVALSITEKCCGRERFEEVRILSRGSQLLNLLHSVKTTNDEHL